MSNPKQVRILLVLCAVSLVMMTAALLFGGRSIAFEPPPFDPAARAGIPDVPAGMGYRELDAGPFRVALCGQIAAENEAAAVYLTNPPDNGVWLKLRMLDESGNLLGETGLVCPGEYVVQMTLQTIPEPGDPLVLKVMAYEPGTYHSQGSVTVRTHMAE